VAAHPVGDDEQRERREDGILVDLTAASGVGGRGP
jgi:hypothetical protein